MENKIQKTKVEEKKDNLSSKDKYNIVLKLYKALADNLEELKSKSNDKKQVTKDLLLICTLLYSQVFYGQEYFIL